ncbi:MAG: RNA-binding domain-containing protein, partial [Methylocystis sp.]
DYKRTIYGNAHADYSEFLADVSSFANTGGGDVVLGMDANNGIPTAIIPLTMAMDAEILRLEQVARGGLLPRIANFSPRAVPIQEGGNVLILRIPRSYNAPHRIIRQNSNRFWARSAAGKYEPDVNELRTLFNAGPQLADRVRIFRLDRIAKIAVGQAPVQLMNSGRLILHLVPFSAFDAGSSLPLRQIEQDYRSFVPMGSSTANGARINFDGVLKTSNADQRATQHRAYVQLYRSGIVESVRSSLVSGSSEAPTIFNLDDTIIREVMRSLTDLTAVGVEPPYALLVSLIDVASARFGFARDRHSQFWEEAGDPLDRDQYHFDEVIFETVPTTPSECANIIRPILDQMANAGGRATSPNFDNQGHYIPPAR